VLRASVDGDGLFGERPQGERIAALLDHRMRQRQPWIGDLDQLIRAAADGHAGGVEDRLAMAWLTRGATVADCAEHHAHGGYR
jgi:hypothetical protein